MAQLWLLQLVLVILTSTGTNQERLASQIQVIRLLRLARLGRLVRVLFLTGSGQGLLPLLLSSQKLISPGIGYFLQLLYAIAVTINFIGCLWCALPPYTRAHELVMGCLSTLMVRISF